VRTSSLLIIACAWLAAGSAYGASLTGNEDTNVREWNFRVLLDGTEIGRHRFHLTDSGDERRLMSEASFDVRFLFVTAYRYRHVNRETWQDGCLSSIQTETRANGKEHAVTGERALDAFVVHSGSGVRELPECVMSFAYWDPRFLGERRLLNPQTGEYLDVDIERIDDCTLNVRGEPIRATRYRIRAREISVDVWYAEDREWVALESDAQGGRVIRYELM